MIHPAHQAHDEALAELPLAERIAQPIAKFMGTGRFLLYQTLFIILWISINLIGYQFRWDPYPFILLNLAFSTQAAYAAPLILLAANRQGALDRARGDFDHEAITFIKEKVNHLSDILEEINLKEG